MSQAFDNGSVATYTHLVKVRGGDICVLGSEKLHVIVNSFGFRTFAPNIKIMIYCIHI